jgi:hypothetical protein
MAMDPARAFARLIIFGLFASCASNPPPPVEPAPAAASTPAGSPEPTEPPSGVLAVPMDEEAPAAETTPPDNAVQPPTEETGAPVAEQSSPPECTAAADCATKGKPPKGTKWGCSFGTCSEVKVAARRKAE